jgi:hypothetical protein
MSTAPPAIAIYLEIGAKRTFAGALTWPGWCRSGRGADAAIAELLRYGPRYAQILHEAGIAFTTPAAASDFVVVEQLPGTVTTDFGAPDTIPDADRTPLDAAELHRLEQLLAALWQGFDRAAQAAIGKTLRTGPRGGGRDLDSMVEHVLSAEAGYLARLARKAPRPGSAEYDVGQARAAVLSTLRASARGETPARGPRGGVIWPPRYFVRRVAWHVTDHLWELEDRTIA